MEGRVLEAEELAQSGDFAAARSAIAKLAEDLSRIQRPDLLARAAWVAAISSLAESDRESFSHLAAIAAEAAALVAGEEIRKELELVAHRVSILARIGEVDDANEAIAAALRDHRALLQRIAESGDQSLWRVADADRSDWPVLFAAVRDRLGEPCRAEAFMMTPPTDGVGRVVLAVALGLDANSTLGIDELARLCFQHDAARVQARERIDELVSDGRLTIIDGGVKARMP